MKAVLVLLGAVAACSAARSVMESTGKALTTISYDVTPSRFGPSQESDHRRKSVFTVQHDQDWIADPTQDSIIPFNKIGRDEDLIFNAYTSVFQARVKGVYEFHFSAASKLGVMKLILNSPQAGGPLATAIAGNTASQASNLVNVELKAGWSVFVELAATHSIMGCSPSCTSFSGRLLYEKQ